MSSIKNSLTTIDQQLLLIANQFDRRQSKSKSGRKIQIEQLFCKALYELFICPSELKESIRDFSTTLEKSCDTTVKYVFRDALSDDEVLYNTTMTSVFSRLNEIENRRSRFYVSNLI